MPEGGWGRLPGNSDNQSHRAGTVTNTVQAAEHQREPA